MVKTTEVLFHKFSSPYGYGRKSVVFRGCVQPTQKRHQTNGQVPVATSARHKTQVIQQNNHEAHAEKCEHHPQHPRGACLFEFRNWWCVATRCSNRFRLCPMHMSRIDMTALRGYSAAFFLLLCHVTECRRCSTRNWFHELHQNTAGLRGAPHPCYR